MATTYDTQIQQLYVAYFNRPADTAGLAFWEGVVAAANGDTSAVSAAFAASTEYKAAYANMTNSAIVTAVYQNLFGHAPDAAGLKFWADNMDAGKLTIDAVVANVAKGALGTDATIFGNKVAAAATFTAALDTTAEQHGYTGDKANVLAKAFIAGVTDDASFDAAVAPAALNEAVGKVVAASGVFSISEALASYDAAVTAKADFLATVDDGDGDATTHNADDSTPAANVASATADIVTGLGTTNGALYSNAATSDAVKAALVSDQIAANASALATAQGHLATANANIAKVAGLSAAISTVTVLNAAADAAHTAATNAHAADLAAQASFAVTAGATANIDTTAGTISAGSTVVATISATSGLATLKSGITASDYAGLTSLISAYNADITANNAAVKADAAALSAQQNVDHLDMDTTATSAEMTTLATVASDIHTMGGVTLAGTASPTEAQIQTEMTILAAKAGASTATPTDTQNLSDFTSHVNAFHAAAAATNPLLTALGDADAGTGAAGEVATATDNLTTFNAAVAALTTANADVAALAGYQAAVDAANGLFTANDYTLVDIDSQPVAGVAIGSAASDVFVAGSANASISLFNLQGTDSLFIGTEYTLNTGKLSTGSDTTLEAFVGTDTSGNATITLEKHAYSSHVAAVAGDTIVITLVGVDASTIHLDSNGIITAGPHA